MPPAAKGLAPKSPPVEVFPAGMSP